MLTLSPGAAARARPVACRVYAGELRGGTLTTCGCRSRLFRHGEQIADRWEPERSLKLRPGDVLFIGDADLSVDVYGFVKTPSDVGVVSKDGRVTLRNGAVRDGKVHVVLCGRRER